MNSGAFFGYKCPRCNTTIDIAAIVGSSEFRCPNCSAVMEPNPSGKTSAANVHCPRCNITIGLINSDKCPKCGGPFSNL